jgi:NAD(P)-dependent dehydrogenase (short-subunit alcohol dehydrogenase family)
METPCRTEPTASPATREVAIVTGGSSGIGRATVLALARAGLDVGFTYRSRRTDAEAVAAAARSHGVRAATHALDLRDAGRGAVAVDALADELGRVDVLVNNAAANPRAAFLRQSLEAWRATLEIDLTGPLACAQAAALRMVAQGGGGRIVNVTSVLERVPLPHGGAYCAAKAALGMLTRVMALELAEHGIRVNAVAPGHTATAMNYGEAHVEAGATDWPAIPLGRSAAPEEIANAIAFLCARQSSYATGGSFLVDGGLLLVAGPGVLQEASGLPPSDGQLERDGLAGLE